jgi:TonB family protein
MGLLIVLALVLGVVFWGGAGRPAQKVAERWNDLPVYPEAEVEKSPLLFSHEIPKPKLEAGRVVSVTVSWIVTPEGVVDDPKIVVSASKEIDAFVVEAVRKWRYEPGQKDGKTVPVRVLRKYTFGQRGSSEGS